MKECFYYIKKTIIIIFYIRNLYNYSNIDSFENNYKYCKII